MKHFVTNAYMIDADYDLSGLKQSSTLELTHSLERFMANKSKYSCDVEKIVLIYFCGSFCIGRKRPKYIEDKISKHPRSEYLNMHLYHVLQIDIDLNAHCKEFFEADKMGSYNIIARTTLEYLSTVPLPVKIRKTFDRELFVNDLREFFVSLGCDV